MKYLALLLASSTAFAVEPSSSTENHSQRSNIEDFGVARPRARPEAPEEVTITYKGEKCISSVLKRNDGSRYMLASCGENPSCSFEWDEKIGQINVQNDDFQRTKTTENSATTTIVNSRSLPTLNNAKRGNNFQGLQGTLQTLADTLCVSREEELKKLPFTHHSTEVRRPVENLKNGFLCYLESFQNAKQKEKSLHNTKLYCHGTVDGKVVGCAVNQNCRGENSVFDGTFREISRREGMHTVCLKKEDKPGVYAKDFASEARRWMEANCSPKK